MDDLFDDLRDLDDDPSSGGGDEFDFDLDSDDGMAVGHVIGEEDELGGTGSSDMELLGMSAGERAFLSMMLFFNVLVLGIGLLIATGRIAV